MQGRIKFQGTRKGRRRQNASLLAGATSASRQTSEGAHILTSLSWAELLTW